MSDPNAVPTPSVYYMRQTNNCLVWVGLSAEDGEALGASWIETFHGTIHSNFVIDGRWDGVFGERDTLGVEGGSGAITVEIQFVSVGDVYEVELLLLDSDGNLHHTKHWVREGTTS